MIPRKAILLLLSGRRTFDIIFTSNDRLFLSKHETKHIISQLRIPNSHLKQKYIFTYQLSSFRKNDNI